MMRTLVLVLSIIVLGCDDDTPVKVDPKVYISEIARFPSSINECSGLIKIQDEIISMNDGSNHTMLQVIDPSDAHIISTINISNINNVDWESIQYANENIYIGDTGNNNGDRQNLSLYTIPYQEGDNLVCTDTINFIWPDQTDFTPSNFHPYDCEAMLIEDGMATFFTKNRSNLKSNVYRLNLDNESITKGESIDINSLVTDAVKDPSGDVILLSYITLDGSLFYNQINILNHTDGLYSLKESITISPNTQIEAIVHLKDHMYLLGAESETDEGGYLYSLDLREYFR